jgi:hypothetical protein
MYCTMDYSNKLMLKRHYFCRYNLYTLVVVKAHSRLLRSEVVIHAKNLP